jgi:hypothetical protein
MLPLELFRDAHGDWFMAPAWLQCVSGKEIGNPAILDTSEQGGGMTTEEGVTGSAWTEAEVETVVAVYFQMLRMQELGQKPNKAEHNRRLQQLLPARNAASIEYKHRNISAVLNLYGAQTLTGYKPLPNFQRLLVDVVGRALEQDRALDEAAIRRVETPAEPPLLDSFQGFVVEVPKPAVTVNDPRLDWVRRTPIKLTTWSASRGTDHLAWPANCWSWSTKPADSMTSARRSSQIASITSPRRRATAWASTSCPSIATAANASSK